jgi:hypothetical protein
MLNCSLGIRRAARASKTMEEAARRMCAYLYDSFRGGAPAEGSAEADRQLALVRLYRTYPYLRLDVELRGFADRLLLGARPSPSMRCLTLLATAGTQPAWNDRRASQGHRAIPLASREMVEQAPMIAELVRAFGLELADVVAPTTGGLVEAGGRTYGIFHVEDAWNSPYIPAQEDFVVPNRIRSVLGFGGALRSGDIFAVILFSRAAIGRDAADRFRTLALDVKSVLFQFDETQVFDQPA